MQTTASTSSGLIPLAVRRSNQSVFSMAMSGMLRCLWLPLHVSTRIVFCGVRITQVWMLSRA